MEIYPYLIDTFKSNYYILLYVVVVEMSENKLYKCIFYHGRACSLREQMSWDDESLNEGIRAISETLESGVYVSRQEYLYKF